MGTKLEETKAEKAQMEQELVAHKADREGAQKDLAEATAVREKEAAEFAASSAELKSNSASVSKAVEALERGGGAAASLVQMPTVQRLQGLLSKLPFEDHHDRD